MNSTDDPETSARLRALTWRSVPEEILSATLQSALEAARSPRGRWWQVMPVPVRWSLAACWTASLALRLSTPTPAALPTVTSQETSLAPVGNIFASSALTTDQINELQRQLGLLQPTTK